MEVPQHWGWNRIVCLVSFVLPSEPQWLPLLIYTEILLPQHEQGSKGLGIIMLML